MSDGCYPGVWYGFDFFGGGHIRWRRHGRQGIGFFAAAESVRKFVMNQRIDLPTKLSQSAEKLKEYLATWKDTPPQEIIKSMEREAIFSDVKREYDVNPDVLKQIPMLVNYGCIFLPALSPIKLMPVYSKIEDNETGDDINKFNKNSSPVISFNINISKIMKVSEIKNYLYANQEYIEEKLKLLGEKGFEVTSEEYKVIDMMSVKPRPKHKEIAKLLGITEESARRKLSDAKKKIKSLFWPKNKQK